MSIMDSTIGENHNGAKQLIVVCDKCRNQYCVYGHWREIDEDLLLIMNRESFSLENEICDKCKEKNDT